jgi:hypothetical protein
LGRFDRQVVEQGSELVFEVGDRVGASVLRHRFEQSDYQPA